ncbi:ion channel [Rhodanobacter sp. A1T4]|uniref:ion channel n=1 Tax=Rhodanobacter sp. A1T4 TaxID=2723087 RepID=UPI00161B15DB|nr:ion channel [Rhodanobacter sp. A1T4]MBB6245108.1 inward rectifier potassium channel [Rhodanobacter sp. A1T4]
MNSPQKLRFRRRPRIVNIGGRAFVSQGLSRRFWDDIYHRALTIRWPTFFALAGAIFLLLNALFAIVYQLGDGSIANQYPRGFGGAFFFSVETLSTVGYGDMHPQTVYAHIVATVEIFTGMVCIAVVTGLIFSRFSRPRAKILFANYPVVRMIDGQLTLMIRAANTRQNVIAEASAQLHLLRLETSPEGFSLRKIYDLKLVRDRHPIFMLSWSLMHVIDASSPLFGESEESMGRNQSTLLLTIEGIDETTAQSMLARQRWSHSDLRWNHRYIDLVSEDADGVNTIDYAVFHEVRPLEDAEKPLG